MKVIFLDVDGVLNRVDSPSMYSLSKTKLRYLREIVKETGAKIVLTSTWRLIPHAKFKLFRRLRYKGMYVWKMTPDLEVGMPYSNSQRGDEVNKFLENTPQVTRYVILDDIDDFLPEHQDKFIKTDPNEGLTKENINEAINILEVSHA